MRVLLLSTALLCIASCTSPQAPNARADLTQPPFSAQRPGAPTSLAAAEPAPVAQPLPPTPAPPPPPQMAQAPPPPAPPPPPVQAVAAPAPAPAPAGTPLFAGLFQSSPPQLLLSNFSYYRAHVETMVTRNPVCGAVGGIVATGDFVLPLNGTRVIAPPPGTDVCWRRDLAGTPGAAAAPQWSHWNRAYLSAGYSIDTQL